MAEQRTHYARTNSCAGMSLSFLDGIDVGNTAIPAHGWVGGWVGGWLAGLLDKVKIRLISARLSLGFAKLGNIKNICETSYKIVVHSFTKDNSTIKLLAKFYPICWYET